MLSATPRPSARLRLRSFALNQLSAKRAVAVRSRSERRSSEGLMGDGVYWTTIVSRIGIVMGEEGREDE